MTELKRDPAVEALYFRQLVQLDPTAEQLYTIRMMAKDNDAWDVADRLMARRNSAVKTVEKFAEDVVKDPLHAFSWSSGAIEAAAMISAVDDVARRMDDAYEKGEDVVKYVESRLRTLLLRRPRVTGGDPMRTVTATEHTEAIRQLYEAYFMDI